MEKETVRYSLSKEQETRISRWHYHGNVKDIERLGTINDATRELARLIMELTPPGRNQNIALTELEAVRMRANAAIAVDESYLTSEGNV